MLSNASLAKGPPKAVIHLRKAYLTCKYQNFVNFIQKDFAENFHGHISLDVSVKFPEIYRKLSLKVYEQ